MPVAVRQGSGRGLFRQRVETGASFGKQFFHGQSGRRQAGKGEVSKDGFFRSRLFRSEMEKIDNPMIRQVRGKGLLNAVVTEPRGGKAAWDICLALKEKGLIAKPTHDHIIRFTPPLVIDRDQMMEAIGIIKDTFAQF